MTEAIQDDAKLWHYTSLPAFLSILQRKQLWFTRLGNLKDPLEGRSEHPFKSEFMKCSEEFTRKGFTHCWCIDNDESDLMWATFAAGFGAAIQTTKLSLRKCVSGSDKDQIVIEPILYGTNWAEGPPDGAFLKRARFKGECELRAYIQHQNTYDPTGREPESDIDIKGKFVDIDPSILLEKVWVPPYSPDWFRDVVLDELRLHGYSGVAVERRQTD